MEGNMFCYQCQEAAKGTGCVLRGVCGKKDTTARYMDLLLFVVRGRISGCRCLAHEGIRSGSRYE